MDFFQIAIAKSSLDYHCVSSTCLIAMETFIYQDDFIVPSFCTTAPENSVRHGRVPWSLSSWVDLEGEDLVLELADGASLLEAETLGGLLQSTNHRRRAAEENLDIRGGLGEPFLKQFISDLRKPE